jgi:hypothetical protein
MATSPYGMLGLGAPEAMEQQRLNAQRNQAMEYARLTPQQQSAFNASNAAQMVGGGLGNLVGMGIGAATGNDTRDPAQKARNVQQQMAAALKDVDPNDIDKAYPIMIGILRDNGMTPEAMAMAKEYEELKLKKQDRGIKQGDLDRRRAADASKVEMFNAALASKDPMRMVEAYGVLAETLVNATPEEKPGIQNRMRALEGLLKMRPEKDAQGNWKVTVQQGNKTDPARVIKYNSLTGETTIETLDGKPFDPNAKNDPARLTPSSQLTKWGTSVTNVAKFTDLGGAFNPRFAGGMVDKIASGVGFTDMIQNIRALAGTDPQASQWWSSYANLIVRIRHEIFGATLTEGEQAAFNAVRALIGMPANIIVSRVNEQAKDALAELDSQVATHKDLYNPGSLPAAIEALKGRVGDMPSGAQSTTRNVAPTAPVAPPAAPAALPPGVTVRRVS